MIIWISIFTATSTVAINKVTFLCCTSAQSHILKSLINKQRGLVLSRAVIRGGAEGALAPPEFGVLEKKTEREIDSLLLSAPPDLKT